MINIRSILCVALAALQISSIYSQAATGGASLADLVKQAGGESTKSTDDLDVLNQNIQDIFGSNTGSSGSTQPSTSAPPIQNNNGNSGSGSGSSIPGTCECVPYYLCNNGSINTNGEGLIDIRVNDGPCESYIEVCCESQDRANQTIKPTPTANKPTGCGYRHPEGVGFRITGDKDNEAQFGEFPWMVAVLREETFEGSDNKLNVYQCGGALIHPSVVVTAAHCVKEAKSYKIRAGEWDTQHIQELYPHQDRPVKNIVIHPQYYAGALYNDVAVLFLETPLDLIETIQPICLPPQNTIVDAATCYATGWGKDVFGKQGKYQVILKKIDLPIVPREQCKESLRSTRLGKRFELHNSFICAGGQPGKDTCKGDGGSPLVCPIPGFKDRFYQMGIVAWGIGCGEGSIPGVYVNIPLFRDWIDNQMKQFGVDASFYTY